MMDLLYSNLEYKSVKDVPPSHFTEQFSKDMQSDNKVQWRFDGDKLAKKKYPERKDVTWNSLSDDEKEAVRVDFRDKMRNGSDDPKRDGLTSLKTQTKEDATFKANLLDEDDNTEFDKIFIIA